MIEVIHAVVVIKKLGVKILGIHTVIYTVYFYN